jgi:hypothetical protein
VLLDRAVLRDPQFAPAIAARGYASWRQYFAGWAKQSQALANAIDDIQAALTADPDSVVAHLTFVRVCWDMGWHESALAAGRLVFSHHPDSLKATLAFARALNNAGMAEFALPLVDSILTADPTNPAALRLRIWCHLMVGSFAHAVGYRATMRRLEQRVAACANAYACDILPAPVVGAALTSWRNR